MYYSIHTDQWINGEKIQIHRNFTIFENHVITVTVLINRGKIKEKRKNRTEEMWGGEIIQLHFRAVFKQNSWGSMPTICRVIFFLSATYSIGLIYFPVVVSVPVPGRVHRLLRGVDTLRQLT